MTEIVVIGCGLAGLSAAIAGAERGAHVTLVSPMVPERSQSVMAMGGINAALDLKGEGDSCEQHFADTMRAGCFIADPGATRRLAEAAPDVIDWLSRQGVCFTRDAQGRPDQRPFGGQRKTRTCYSGARTGKQLVSALSTQVRRHEAAGRVTRLLGRRLLSLARDADGRCVGVVLLDQMTNDASALPADTVILAFGAPNGVWGKTTGSQANDGCAAGIAMRDGLSFGNLEMVQFHPTTLETPSKRMLITEAARGLGGRLYALRDGRPWYFMEEWYPELGALMPRDVVSRSIYRVVHEMGLKHDGRDEVLLDITHLRADVIERDLDEVLDTCLTYRGIDPRVEPIPVYPGVHFSMGGILVDEGNRADVDRVMAAGECACQFHGANRLGGNSTLAAVHGGRLCAESAVQQGPGASGPRRDAALDEALAGARADIAAWSACGPTGEPSRDVRARLVQTMHACMGIYRDAAGLERGLGTLRDLFEGCRSTGCGESYYDFLSTREELRLAVAMVGSALERKESRGAHQRTDFPDTDDERYRATMVTSWRDGRARTEVRACQTHA
jgi:succinate dehydrogenase / fumarate reductase flavoprotein subunit